MRKVRVAAFIVLMILLIACQPRVDVQLTATSTLKPKNTSIPPTTTATPFPPLAENPNYLGLIPIPIAGNKRELFFYNLDGTDKRVVKLPENINWKISSSSISPDGKWIAFYTGSIGVNETPDDLTCVLHIMSIDNGKTLEVAKVVSEDYQEKLKDLANKLKSSFPDFYRLDSVDTIYRVTKETFSWDMNNKLSWSPDSRYLAFAGQINGLSSDVYLYDIENNKTQRLIDDYQNVNRIYWSPSGKYIVLYNQKSNSTSYDISLHVINPTNKIIKTPRLTFDTLSETIVDWISEDVLLMTDNLLLLENHKLIAYDVTTGVVKTLWDDLYGEAVVDHQNQVIAMSTSDNSPADKPSGIYFVDFNGKKKLMFEGYFEKIAFRGGKNRFLFTNYSDIFSVDLNGNVTKLKYLEFYSAAISLDYSWLLIYNDEEIYLYDENDNFVKNLDISGIESIVWHRDSQGFFYSTGNKFYYFELQNGNTTLIDQCAVDDCYFHLVESNVVWLP